MPRRRLSIRALGLGGAEVASNRAPAHKRPCHEWQTRVTDIPAETC